MSAPAGWWRRGKSRVWHFVPDGLVHYHPLGGYFSAMTACERHEFATDGDLYSPFIGEDVPKVTCKRCAESYYSDIRAESAKRAAYLSGVRAGLEAAREEAREHSCMTWAECCDCSGKIASAIGKLDAESIAKEAEK